MYLALTDRTVTATHVTAAGRRTGTPRIVVTLGLVGLLTAVSSGAVAAILPLYLTAVLGLSIVAYGVVDGLQHGVGALVRMGGGWAADRSDHPKWVAFATDGISCVARVGLLLTSGLGAIVALVAVDGVGKGAHAAPRDAMIAEAARADRLGDAFGVHRALAALGAVLGPLIAFCLLWAVPHGYVTVMVVSLAFAVAGVALLGLTLPDERPRRHRTVRSPRPFKWGDVADPRLVRLLGVVGILGVLTVGDGFLYLALLDRSHLSLAWFPLLYVATNLAFVALAVPAGRLADRVGRARMLVLGHLALVAAYACAAAPFGGWGPLLAVLLLLGGFYAATDGLVAAVAGRMVVRTVRASGIASAQTVVALARMVSSMVFGLLWFLVGPQLALVIIAGCLLAALPQALVQVIRLDHQAELA